MIKRFLATCEGKISLNKRFISTTSTVNNNKFGNWGSNNSNRQRQNKQQRVQSKNNVNSKKRLVNMKDYNDNVDSFFDKVYNGVLPMKIVNTGFEIEKKTLNDEKILSVILGEECEYSNLTLQTVHEDRTLEFFSPASGKLIYSYCNETNTFRSVEDDHDLLGILTRDLIKDAKGFPDF